MHKRKMCSFFVFMFTAALMAGQSGVIAQTTANKQISKDEVFFSIARRINSVSESPVSAIVAELDGVIEVTAIASEPDGKSLVTEGARSIERIENK